MTRGDTSVLSMSAGMQNNSSRLDLDVLKHFDAYQSTSNHTGITYYECPANRDILQPTAFNTYCDLVESKHVDRQAHWAWAIEPGLRDHLGGAPAGSQLNTQYKMIVTLRHAAEEIAGLDSYGNAVDEYHPKFTHRV